MRAIKHTKRFKKDYKREKRSQYAVTLDNDFLHIIKLLSTDKPLPERCCDHALKGEWNDHRDCHIKPDLVLIYRKPDNFSLELVRLGSHSELSL